MTPLVSEIPDDYIR